MKKLALLPLLFLTGCFTLITNFDQNTYNNATTLKVESLELIDKGSEPANIYRGSIVNLQSKLDYALAYEEGKGKANHTSQAQWKLLADHKGNLMGGYLENWKDGYSKAFVKEKHKQISDAFDEIIKLESAKNR